MPSPLMADTWNTAASGASRSVWVSNRFPSVTARILDPCRFIRQVNEFGRLENRSPREKTQYPSETQYRCEIGKGFVIFLHISFHAPVQTT